ncbi:MAG: ABC transporter substrate-binding protein [Deltaproteobacteria bacterium]|nr:ABC transporter substrate-binding protein [Deltaproteobacteria bacterium]
MAKRRTGARKGLSLFSPFGGMALLLAVALALTLAPSGLSADDPLKLKIATLPIADTILLHLAKDLGYFGKAGLDVELVPFQSAMEKDQAIIAGGLDGHFCEMGSVIMQRSQGLAYMVVAATSHTDPAKRVFGLVTKPGSVAKGVSDLEGSTVGIAKLYMVDFMTDAILRKAGLPMDYLKRSDVKRIPIRYQMLVAGQLDSALFPEPMLTMAEKEGGKVLLDDRDLDMPLAVVALRADLAQAQVAAFQGAIAGAVSYANANEPDTVARMGALRLIPPALSKDYRLMAFDPKNLPYRLPDRSLYGQYVDWLTAAGALGDSLPGGARPAPSFEDVVFQGAAPAKAGD